MLERHASDVSDLVHVQVLHAGRRYWRYADGTLLPVVAGADGEPVVPTVPEDLTGLDDAAVDQLLRDLEAAYRAQREAATVETLAQLRTIREAQTRLDAERTRRREAQEALDTALTELDAQTITLPDPGDPVARAEETNEPALVDAQAAAAEPAPTAPATPAVAVASAGDVADARPGQPTAVQTGTPARTRPREVVVASAGQQQFPQGHPLTNAEIGALFGEALSTPDTIGRDSVHRVVLAGMGAPDWGLEGLDRSNVVRNDELIGETLEARRRERDGETLDARTAAICGPLDIERTIPRCQDTSENVSGRFPSRPAGRLGFQFTPPSALSTVQGTGTPQEWTPELQALVDEADPSTWKPCLDVTCVDPVAVRLTEVVGCVTVEESTSLSAPERVDEVMRLVQAQLARVKVGMLLQFLYAGSRRYTDDNDQYGASVQLSSVILRTLQRANFDNRLDTGAQPYTAFVGPGMAETLAYDRLARGFQPTECQPIADALNCVARETGIRDVVQLQDIQTGAGAPGHPFGGALPAIGDRGALPLFPTTFDVFLVPTESWLYSSTGEMETGLQSDPQLARQNRRQWFRREWFTLAPVGCAPTFRVRMTVCASGARASLVTATCSGAPEGGS